MNSVTGKIPAPKKAGIFTSASHSQSKSQFRLNDQPTAFNCDNHRLSGVKTEVFQPLAAELLAGRFLPAVVVLLLQLCRGLT
ncbi:hypothetical protein PEC301899_13880 [Pectobacterium carotovorum subsp. carotovorum]|nr:hypothetical protein PEC301899_13880 [Pectobacterium carotovorum subsp. carotovorum]